LKVLVDTCIWSQSLRRNIYKSNPVVIELIELIKEVRVQMIGPIRQELLSGIRSATQYENLKNHLSAFPDLMLKTQDYEKAAEYYNLARKNGIQGSNTDFLICSISNRYNMPIFTVDNDFELFKNILPIELYQIRKYSE